MLLFVVLASRFPRISKELPRRYEVNSSFGPRLQHFLQPVEGFLIDTRTDAFSRSCDVQDGHIRAGNPRGNVTRVFGCHQIDDTKRLVQALSSVDRQCRAARGLVACQDERAVRVADVPSCSLGILLRRRFLQRVDHRDSPVFGQAPLGAPSAGLQPAGQSNVEGCPVNSRLST